jgi:uncharacterized protein YdhG (YjbR/CyaY superfamily)
MQPNFSAEMLASLRNVFLIAVNRNRFSQKKEEQLLAKVKEKSPLNRTRVSYEKELNDRNSILLYFSVCIFQTF